MSYPSLYKVQSKLPGITGQRKLIAAQQTTNDIINAVIGQHNINVKQAQNIAHYFDAGDIYQTCQNIWNFLKYEVPYKVEPANKQTAKTISRIVYDAANGTGKNDCKHYSNFAGAVLHCLGIPFCYRFAGYSNYSNLPTHVYIVANPGKNEVILDAVLNSFDTEKPYKIKIDKNMALYKLSGIEADEIMIGGVWDKTKKFAKKAGKSIAKTAKAVKQGAVTASLAIPRSAMILLLRFNVHGWATGLKNKTFDELKWWKDFGGNRTTLMDAIKEGSKKKRILGIENDMLYDINAIGLEPISTSATLIKASPIIIKITSVLEAAEKVSNKIEKITDPVNKTLQAADTAKKGFEQVTGKKIEDIIFKKDEGKKVNVRDNIQLNKPTDAEALKIAQAAVKGGAIDNKKLFLIGGAGLLAAILLMKRK